MKSSFREKQSVSLGHFIISVGPELIYIKHNKSNKIIYIRRDNFEMSEQVNFDDFLNKKHYNDFQADSIIGILNYDKKNKYLLFVGTSKIAAKFKDDYIYNIDSVNYLKINFAEVPKEEKERIRDIKNLFSSKHFYYSNTYDISKSLQIHDNDIDNDNYLINATLLNDFRANNIPLCFYSYVIFGYVGGKIGVNIISEPEAKPKKIDIVIIERTHKEYMRFTEEISRQIRQIEFLTIYKLEQAEDCVFSMVLYICNEIYYQNIKNVFNPYHPFIKKELDNFEKIICIINDIYIRNNNNTLTDFIHSSEELNHKVILINQINKDWKPGLYFESNENCLEYLTSYFQNVQLQQGKVIWFVDVNNNMVRKEYMNDKCFHALIRILWISIQKQINDLNWNINIGNFGQDNKTNLSFKFREIIEEYFTNLGNKKILHGPDLRNNVQSMCDTYFSVNVNVINSVNENNISLISKMSSCAITFDKNENIDKLSILCITWNVDNLPIEDAGKKNYKVNDLFTKNSLYVNKELPDIIFISLQKIVKISNSKEDNINALHEKRYKIWTSGFQNIIKNLYPNCVYVPFKDGNFLGNCFISFVKYDLKEKVKYKNLSAIKYDIETGNKGDKGFFSLIFEYNGNNIATSSVFLNSKNKLNNKNLEKLNDILNTEINIETNNKLAFKDIDYWMIFGDFNFKVDLDYEPVMELIKKNNAHYLLNNDQFYKNKNRFNDLNLINESNVLFYPTYKYEKDTNKYVEKGAKNKVPSYTDRIFYKKRNGINNLYYNAVNSINYSSHKPLIGVFEIVFEDFKSSKKFNSSEI